MKKLIILAIIILLLFSQTACQNKNEYVYNGDNIDLYTVVINSVLGARGYRSNGNKEPLLQIVENDEFGRIMFIYYEARLVNEYNFVLAIAQKSEEGKVYFYPDYNFVFGELDNNSIQDRSTEDYDFTYYYPPHDFRAKFSNNQIEQLKIDNDWNEEINEAKCIIKEATNTKHSILSKKEKRELYSKLYGESIYYSDTFLIFLTNDNYGRSLYFASNTDKADYRAVIVDSSKKEKSIVIKNIRDYQEILRVFKEENNWDKSL